VEGKKRREPTPASLWRIEFARELTPFYSSHAGIEMIILSGSPPKGLSDAYSDLDMIVFWNAIDFDWLERIPLRDIDCERAFYRKLKEEYLESYYFGELKVDLGHTTINSWKEMVDGVLERHETDLSAQAALGGFLSSLPLYGRETFEEWRETVAAYPDELAEKMIRQHMRLFVCDYLKNQAHGRGEILAYYDGVCRMLKNLLGILAGLNRVYAFTDEPRWIEYYLEQMSIRPENAWERIRSVLESAPEEGLEVLEGLIGDVLDLIDEHRTAIDTSRVRRGRKAMRVRARERKPALRPRKDPASTLTKP